MALLRKRYSSFGREDKTFGIRALIKGDSWLVRISLYVILGLLFYLVVQMTHKTPTPTEMKQEQPTSPFPADTDNEK